MVLALSEARVLRTAWAFQASTAEMAALNGNGLVAGSTLTGPSMNGSSRGVLWQQAAWQRRPRKVGVVGARLAAMGLVSKFALAVTVTVAVLAGASATDLPEMVSDALKRLTPFGSSDGQQGFTPGGRKDRAGELQVPPDARRQADRPGVDRGPHGGAGVDGERPGPRAQGQGSGAGLASDPLDDDPIAPLLGIRPRSGQGGGQAGGRAPVPPGPGGAAPPADPPTPPGGPPAAPPGPPAQAPPGPGGTGARPPACPPPCPERGRIPRRG
ncbi:MAG TPA: hypothetical protein VM324_10390, partial [Egibacteraceae bacterium]|nr:hypothetical protein [Egibacteraceae bacterium]